MDAPESSLNSNELNAVTVPHTDKEQAAIYGNLARLDSSLEELAKAGMMQKGQKAEIVIKQTRDLLGQLASANHALMNELARVKGELLDFKKNGFGG